MASEHQVALTRAQRMPAPSSHISKAARQVVPAFLQKLYEMVNDPNNAELIRWSEAGDSFFVLDHERFAHEVLGRWFKHRNFSSFVRQLNMYGFHKIPHLQQGVLKSDSDTEFWNFAHQNFHRGQPDLLCLIQRKKQVPQPGEDGAIDLRDPNAVGLLTGAVGAGQGGQGAGQGAQPGAAGLSSNQILDIHSIVNGIQAIKRHQTTISAELNELKRSNQLLWQDALAARARHQKQQDTINRIVKFLAGVFGHHAAAGSAGGVGVGPSSPGVGGGQHGKDELGGNEHGTRRRMRLMIEDATRDGPRKSMIEELTEMPIDADEAMYDSTYPTIETPISAPSPSPSLALSDNISISDNSGYYHNKKVDSANSNPQSDNRSSTSSNSNASTPNSVNTDSPILGHASTTPTQQQPQHQSQHQQGKEISRAVTPASSRLSPSSFDFDSRIHGVLNQLSPAQIQSLLASLASQTISDPNTNLSPSSSLPPHSTVNPSATTTTSGGPSGPGTLTPYLQPSSFDFSINPASSPSGQPSSFSGISSMPFVSPDGLIPFDSFDPSALRSPDLNLINSNSNANANAGMGLTGLHGGLGLGLGLGASGSGSGEMTAQQQQEHEERMHRHWQGAEDVDKEMSMVDSSIQSLIQTFGLDPSLLLLEDTGRANAAFGPVSLGPTAGVGGGGLGGDGDGDGDGDGSSAIGVGSGGGSGMTTGVDTTPGAADFDFDTFFNNLSSSTTSAGTNGIPSSSSTTAGVGDGSGVPMDYNDIVSNAFLTDDPSTSGAAAAPIATATTAAGAPTHINRDLTASPMQSIRHVSPGLEGDNADDTSGGVLSLSGDDDVHSSGLPTTTTPTTMIGRKRKSELDLEGLAGALDSGGAQSTTVAAGGAKAAGAGTKTKRRKDK